jgi:hypothetical protein
MSSLWAACGDANRSSRSVATEKTRFVEIPTTRTPLLVLARVRLEPRQDWGRRNARLAALLCERIDRGRCVSEAVQAVLGHSNAAITLKTYAHLYPGDEDRTRTVMDSALSALVDSVPTDPLPRTQSRRSRG